MQKIKDILRLRYGAELSIGQIAVSLGLSSGVVAKYLSRAQAAGLGRPLPDGLSEAELAARLRPARSASVVQSSAEPDFIAIQTELRTKGITRQLLWEEYAEAHPDDHYSYSRFTVLDATGPPCRREGVYRLLRPHLGGG